MPQFSDETIKKHPWMWKMDSRRKSSCAVAGHRFRWFKQKGKRGKPDTFFGACRKCAVSYTYTLTTDAHGQNVTVRRAISKTELVSEDKAGSV